MTWLMTHMWIVAGATGVVALLLGWSIRGVLLSGKMRKAIVERDMVKVELSDSKEEVEKLFAQVRKLQSSEGAPSNVVQVDPTLPRKIESLTAELARKSAEIEQLKAAAPAPAAVPSPAAAGHPEDPLLWRNRHLETRVQHLEAELAKKPAPAPTPAPASQSVTEVPAAPAVDTSKLQWEVNYLRTRVAALQDELAAVPVAAPAVTEAPAEAPAADPSSPIEEEVARLRWRVRFLEGRLAYFEGDAEAQAEGEAAPEEEPAPAAKTASAAEKILGQLEAADEAADAEDARQLPRVRPASLDKPFTSRGDDLTQIGGIGPKIQDVLNSLGIYHFEQIAEWSPENVAWVDDYLSFAGRITREGWVEQAKVLAGEGAEA